MPGQTRRGQHRQRRCRPDFNGGPDNCPAKPPGAGPAPAVVAKLQWRAGQLPGQTPPAAPPSRRARRHFNGGPDNCPAKLGLVNAGKRRSGLTSMEGRTIARPNRHPLGGLGGLVGSLQWRAGQLPGQTPPPGTPRRRRRELQWRAGQLPGQTALVTTASPGCRVTSMEGRTIARPNLMHRLDTTDDSYTSMEGRTIARPNHTPRRPRTRRPSHFNGGPDNCPAKLRLPLPVRRT